MQTSVTFKNLDPSDNLKSYVGDKLDRFDKFLDNPAAVTVQSNDSASGPVLS